MLQPFASTNITDENGNPAGGTVDGIGLQISWQNGPLGRGIARKEPNGAFVETVIAAAVQRLNFYQTASNARFACMENLEAIEHLLKALEVLQERTARREEQRTEGTHEGA